MNMTTLYCVGAAALVWLLYLWMQARERRAEFRAVERFAREQRRISRLQARADLLAAKARREKGTI